MVNKIGTVYTCGSNKFCVDSQVWHETPEEGPKDMKCNYNSKD